VGQLGEYISSYIPAGSSIAMTTGVGINVTSISLTGGDWDVVGWIGWNGSATFGLLAGDISTSSATRTYESSNDVTAPASAFNALTVGPHTTKIQMHRISLATTTTVYLVAFSYFSAGTAFASYGKISARRVR